MEQRVEYFANLVFYHLYRFEKWIKSYLAAPMISVIRLPAVDRYFKKQGIDKEKEINKTLYDPKVGQAVIFANWHFGLLLYLISCGTANFLIGLFWLNLAPFGKGFLPLATYFLVTFIPTLIVSEVLVERKNKYLKYFKQFERQSEQWHFRTAWLAFFTVIGIWGYAIGGVAFYLSRL